MQTHTVQARTADAPARRRQARTVAEETSEEEMTDEELSEEEPDIDIESVSDSLPRRTSSAANPAYVFGDWSEIVDE